MIIYPATRFRAKRATRHTRRAAVDLSATVQIVSTHGVPADLLTQATAVRDAATELDVAMRAWHDSLPVTG